MNKNNDGNDSNENNENNREKRKRSEDSSVSELDISSSETKKNKSKRKKKSQNMQQINEQKESASTEAKIDKSNPQGKSNNQEMSEIKKQLKEMNDKLSNMMTKNDGTLRDMIKDVFDQVKDELLKSVSKRIEILEGKLFDKEVENDRLKENIKSLEKDIKNHKDQNDQLRSDLDAVNNKTDRSVNRLEQYSRRNSIRVDGVTVTGRESVEKTTELVCNTLNEKLKTLKLDLDESDIDVAHRVGKTRKNKQQIIVKFQSRMLRDKIISNKKMLKGTGIFLSEDLTSLNFHVLSCVRYKAPDEVEAAWTQGGRIFYVNSMGNKHEVKERDYVHWIEMKWPEKELNYNKGK